MQLVFFLEALGANWGRNAREPPARKQTKGMLLIPGTENGERGTGNGSLGTSVQR